MPEANDALQIVLATGLASWNKTLPVGVPLEPVTLAVKLVMVPGESGVLLAGAVIVTVAGRLPPNAVVGPMTIARSPKADTRPRRENQ
ncbi:MAG TPA: hypothetical protein VGK54_00665 [Chloroflexota bacterium]